MSNSLLTKTHFDLLTGAIIVGPSDATGWDLELDDLGPDQVGQLLVTENLRSTLWHRVWPDVHRENGDDSKAGMLASSQLAAALVDDPQRRACVFEPDELAWRQSYRYQARELRLSCVQLLDLLGTWEYHSGEHLTWQEPFPHLEEISEAHSLVFVVRDEVIARAPGVPESPWDAYTDLTAPVIGG